MKRILSLILLFVSFLAQAQDYSLGNETLSYTIRHNLFPGNIGTMTFDGRPDGENYRLEATLTAAVGSIYTLDCQYGSTFIMDEALTPVAADRSQTEKKYWAKGIYDWETPGKVHLDVTKSSRPHRDEILEWDGIVRDLLGMLWRIRTLDYGSDSTATVPEWPATALLLDHDPLPVSIASCKRKTIKFEGKPTPVIVVVLVQDGKEALSMTITDDASRTPLRFSIGLSFGTIKGTLKK